jgi:serpin B
MPESNINGFVENLSQKKMSTILLGLKDETINFKMPEFTFETQQDLVPYLNELGISTAFLESADFSLMSKEDKLFFNKVQHNTFIDVSYQGVEAAGVTVVESRSLPDKPKFDVVVNKPFIFAIRHNKKKEDLIFLGKFEKF